MEILDSEKPTLLKILRRELILGTEREVNAELSNHALYELEQIRVMTARLINDVRLSGKSRRLVYLAEYNIAQAELLNMGMIDLMENPFVDLNRYSHESMADEPGKGMLMIKARYFLKKHFSH